MGSLLLVAGLFFDLVAGGPAPSCVRQNDRLVCGFHCTSNLNQAACAQTPEGLCAATPTEVVCWDPPPDVRMIMQSRADELPQPSCITSINGAACGYFCERTGDEVACAATPFGACATRFGVLRCWDPAPEVRWEMEARGDLQAASCERTLDKVACGYACVSSLKSVACAQTPWGRCTRSFDQIACWDPQFIVSPPAPSAPSASALAR